jgi:hypothetical protein
MSAYRSSLRQDGPVVWVTLSLPEMIHGATVGAIRAYESITSGMSDAHGFDARSKSGLSINVDGACAEIAVARVRDVYFIPTVNTFKDADIGSKIQVRSTASHSNRLLVRSDDDPNHYFVLVTGSAPDLCVRGYIKGSDAMSPMFLDNPGHREEAWFVPQSYLKPMKIKRRGSDD